jgi:tetratricopeptide (TPR) repeat protein
MIRSLLWLNILVAISFMGTKPLGLCCPLPPQETGAANPGSEHHPSERALAPAASPQDDLGRVKNIESYLEKARYQKAIPLLKAYLQDYPNSSRGHYDLGYATFRTHDFPSSIKSLSKSLSLNANDPEAHKILALDCSSVGRYDLAETELREAIRQRPNAAEYHYFLGRVYYSTGVYPLAKKELEEAIRLQPSYMKAYDNLGLTMEVLGDNAAALRNYVIAQRLNEEQELHSEWPCVDISAYFNLQEKPDQALQYARKAVETNPNSAMAYFEMAKAFRTKAQWNECADSARKAIALDPRNSNFYYVLGIALRKLGDAQGSAAAMETFRRIHQEELNKYSQDRGDHTGRGMEAVSGRLDHE